MFKESQNDSVKCPECGSANVRPTGFSHSVGAGVPMREPDTYQYRCADCDALFHDRTPKV